MARGGPDIAHGLASDHTAAIPYAVLRSERNGWKTDLRAGYSRSFISGHGAHAAAGSHSHVLVVNPHADQEIVYRATVLRREGKIGWAGVLEGRHPLDGEWKGKGSLTLGTTIDIGLGGGISTGILAELPLSRPRRFENRFGLRVGKRF